MKYNIKLTIKAIIRFEQLMDKPFSMLDYNNEKDFTALLYCMALVNNNLLFTYEEFLIILENDKQLKNVIKEFECASKVAAQFQIPPKKDKESSDSEPIYIKDLISLLIIDGGLNPVYAMNEMSLQDIPMYIQAYEKKKREQMEASRLWTFLSILPHVDTKKLSSAKDLYLFPWEIEESKQKAEKELKENAERFERFFKEGMNLIKQKDNGR